MPFVCAEPTLPSRWRALEASLAAIGSQAEDVLDVIDDERESGRAKPIDIESLLTNVIPNFLVLSRTRFSNEDYIMAANVLLAQSSRSCKVAPSYLRASMPNFYQRSWRANILMRPFKYSRPRKRASR